jgi:hypothetical protein
MRFTPDTWRIVGYVRDVVIILGIALGGTIPLVAPREVRRLHVLAYRLPLSALGFPTTTSLRAVGDFFAARCADNSCHWSAILNSSSRSQRSWVSAASAFASLDRFWQSSGVMKGTTPCSGKKSPNESARRDRLLQVVGEETSVPSPEAVFVWRLRHDCVACGQLLTGSAWFFRNLFEPHW